MTLTNLTIQDLYPIVKGGDDRQAPQYRSLDALVTLFQRYGRQEVYDFDTKEPIKPGTDRTYSRVEYVKLALREMNGTPKMYQFIHEQLNNPMYHDSLQSVLEAHGYRIDEVDGRWIVSNVDVEEQTNHVEISFAENRDKILARLNQARVSIDIAMAWFTSDAFIPTLLSKKREGVTIRILINRDIITSLHGCDLSMFDVKYIRGEHGGIMHDKLCIIDNQIVITGSYNWTANAESRNVENVAFITRNDVATEASVEFRRLWNDN